MTLDDLGGARAPRSGPEPRRPRKRKRRKLPIYLTEREQQLVLDTAAASSPRGVPHGALRDRALIAVLVFSGIRIAEAQALERDDVDLNELEVFVREGKGGKPRIVPLDLEAAIAVESYVGARSDEEPALFISRMGRRASIRTLRDVVYRVTREAALTKRISPHKLRHTFATLTYDRTGDLVAVKDLLGHESIRTTEIYTHVARGRLRKIIDSR